MYRFLVFVFAVTLFGSCESGVVDDIENKLEDKAENKVNTKVGFTAIPDENFEKILIDYGYDDVVDGQVLTESIDTIQSLNLTWYDPYFNPYSREVELNGERTILSYDFIISNLTGIEAFIALKKLCCAEHKIRNIDVSNNYALTELYCGYNQLTSLDVSQNIALTKFACNNNQLTSLDLTQNTALTNLSCNNNQLTKIDISNNTALKHFDCRDNQLANLDIRNNVNLEDMFGLYCDGNRFDCDSLNKFRELYTYLYATNKIPNFQFLKDFEYEGNYYNNLNNKNDLQKCVISNNNLEFCRGEIIEIDDFEVYFECFDGAYEDELLDNNGYFKLDFNGNPKYEFEVIGGKISFLYEGEYFYKEELEDVLGGDSHIL